MAQSQCFYITGFLTAVTAAALRFTVLLIEDHGDRRLVTNLAVATAALAIALFGMGVVNTC
ncbi:hypothetical protein O4214_05340 [Rhodococcus erythropolis]|uniref:hypothetical protein n=1 Tax=Rhodococcus erythropolis TaxID=1833 RepID=UPI001E4957CD|nr:MULTISPECIES: hypothetical protein [Rhodococcus erythropolis group]MCD2104342.1 hypothetical protein [Rhodococcus qingshengii]MCZ4523397.1 hypothetical protein [Rhodococcus erythropolis]